MVLLLTLAACGPRKPAPAAPPAKAAPAAAPAAAASGVLLKGAGLPGLPKIPTSAYLGGMEMANLLAVVYPDQPLGAVTVQRDDQLYDAKPLVAFRSGDEIILLVTHTNSLDCHACMGATSIFYLDKAGQKVVRQFPFFIIGAEWGGTGDVNIVKLPDGGTAVFLATSGGGQGIYCSLYQITQLAPGNPVVMGMIPDSFTDAGAYGKTGINIAGIGVTGRTMKIRWLGTSQTDGGAQEVLNEERDLTLDGVDDPWIASWPHAC